MFKASKEEIEAWKEKHEAVYLLKVEDKQAYIHSPTRKDLSYASKVGAKDPLKFNEHILTSCWLGGDKEIKTVDSYFMGASSKISEIIQIREASLEKL